MAQVRHGRYGTAAFPLRLPPKSVRGKAIRFRIGYEMTWNSLFITLSAASALTLQAAEQPKIEARNAPVIAKDGLKFRDLNRNGSLDPYEDWRLPVEQRIADLLSRMTAEEKVGLMIHSSLSGFTGPNGEVLGLPAAGGRGGRGGGRGAAADSGNRSFQGRNNPYNVEPMGSANPSELIVDRHVRWILVRPNAGEAPQI